VTYSEAFSSDLSVGLSYGFVSFTKTSDDGSVSEAVPLGLSAQIGYFLTNQLALSGNGGLALELEDKSAVFLGGSLGLSYFLSGGRIQEAKTNTVKYFSSPKLGFFVFVGAGGYTFNFTTFDKSVGKLTSKKAKNNVAKGFSLGTSIGGGASVAVSEKASLVLRGSLFNGLTDDVTPGVSTVTAGGGVEVHL